MRKLFDLWVPRLRPGEVSDEEVLAAIRSIPRHFACLGFSVPFKAVAVTATPSTVAGIKTPANQKARLKAIRIGFDDTTSTHANATIELGTCTFGANSPGTNSTSVTPNPDNSTDAETIQSACGKAWTTEPTTISVTDTFMVPTYLGSGIIEIPLTRLLIAKGGNGLVMRVTVPNSCNATGALIAEE